MGTEKLYQSVTGKVRTSLGNAMIGADAATKPVAVPAMYMRVPRLVGMLLEQTRERKRTTCMRMVSPIFLLARITVIRRAREGFK